MKQEHEENTLLRESISSPAVSINRNFKDTLFRRLFQEKEALLELYNAVNHTNYTEAADLEIITLENTIYMNMKNDLAFLINFQLHMYEHQSTVNPNMPLRFLQYVSREYEKLIERNTIYRSKQIKLPSPHFVVFYNGSREQPERQELRLSDAYEVANVEPKLELKVMVLNIKHGNNQQLVDQCKTLKQYVQYIECVRKYSEHNDIETAVELAITECINNGVLQEFLQKNRSEAKSMSIFEYHEEEVLRLLRMDEREEARKELRDEVRNEVRNEVRTEVLKEIRDQVQAESILKLVKIVCNMQRKGISVGEIAEDLCENLDYIQSICEITKLSAPNYDIEWICEKVMEQHS